MDILMILIYVVAAVLGIILFFKVWGMCNDVDKILKIVNKSTGKDEITILIIEGKYDEAEAVLNRTIAGRIASLYRPDSGYTTETLDKKLTYIFNEYEPYYEKMGRQIPEILKNTTGADAMQWYKYYAGNSWDLRKPANVVNAQ